jgi:hypothetical protein
MPKILDVIKEIFDEDVLYSKTRDTLVGCGLVGIPMIILAVVAIVQFLEWLVEKWLA